MQIFNAILAFVTLYNVYSQVYPLLASDSCVAGIAIFIASTVIDRLFEFEDAILVVCGCLVFGQILAGEACPGGVIFALRARNQVIHFVICEEDSDTVSEPSFESSDVTLVATTKLVPAIDPAVLKSIGLSAISVNNLIVSSMDEILATSASKAVIRTPVPAALLSPALSHLHVSRRLPSKPQDKSASSRVNNWLSSRIKTPSAHLPAIIARSTSALKVVDADVLDAVFDNWEKDNTRGLHASQYAPGNAVHLPITPSPPPSPSTRAVAISGHRSAAATSASSPPIATLKATPLPSQAPVSVPATAFGSSALEDRPLAVESDALLPVPALPEAPDLTLETEWTPTVLIWQAPRRPTVQDYNGVGASRWSDARMHMRVDDLDTLMVDDAESADVRMDDAEDFDLDFLMYNAQDLDTIMEDAEDFDLDFPMDDAKDIDTIMYEVNDIDAIMDDGDASPT